MTTNEMIIALNGRLAENEEVLMANTVPDGDYGFVVTADRSTNSSHSLRRYQIMESINCFDNRCIEVIEIDTVDWKESWNTFDEAV